MDNTNLKNTIQTALKDCLEQPFNAAASAFFNALGYETDRKSNLQNYTFDDFDTEFIIPRLEKMPNIFNYTNALGSEWLRISQLFQLTEEDIQQTHTLFSSAAKTVNMRLWQSYMFFGIELTNEHYTRTQLGGIVRELNRLTPMPAMLLFKHGDTLTFAVVNRRLNQKDSNKKVVEKVTLIKDIRCQNPHRAHLDILSELALRNIPNVLNFNDLHEAWRSILDLKALNNRFYKELFTWYLWARKTVNFPKPTDDQTKNEVIQSVATIRLLTRLIFIWFLKEKGLVSDDVFNTTKINEILDDFETCSTTASNYYNGILQNLFFATLNSPMNKDAKDDYEKRQFVNDIPKKGNYSEAHTDQTKYRGDDLFKDKKALIDLFAQVPFLNGGLFECLDKRENNKEIRYDGFSENKAKRASVPNCLFFGESQQDFAEDLADKKAKNTPVRGIINILNDYKFTIEENTPLEEDVALDPELLGKVFENLLASYNPETKTTARKQTGSFYTPREIVDYMVDESLKAYLSQVGVTKDLHDLDNSEKTSPRSDALIQHLSNCRILDPACGSGAFPMGVLHKMVEILRELDPNNTVWRKTQEDKAIAEIAKAYKENEEEERKKRLAYIEAIFTENTNNADYARKLFLIENCIFGVDIQPIAIQISKLRFFISLLVEQNPNDDKENRGILSMPNLETKFVTANTLVGLAKNTELTDPRVTNIEKELDNLREQLFYIKKYADKKNLIKQEVKKRAALYDALENAGMGIANAKLKTDWNPFDTTSTAPFFDATTMFGSDLKDGFDVVIGNPPYVNVKNGIDTELKIKYKKEYTTAIGQFDLFTLFSEFSIKNSNTVCFIVPKPIINNENYIKIRALLKTNGLSLVITGSGIFENAGVESCIFLTNKTNKKKEINILEYQNENFIYKNEISLSKIIAPNYIINTEYNNLIEPIIDKVNKSRFTLSDIIRITRGIEGGKKDESLTTVQTEYRLIKGEDLIKYNLKFKNVYVNFEDNNISKFKNRNLYFQNKLLIRRVTSDLIATYDTNNYVVLNTVYCGILKNNNFNLLFTLAILNSRLLNFWFKITFISTDKLFPYMRVSQLEQIPIPNISITAQQPFVTLVETILAQKTEGKDTTDLEAKIDDMVYALYDLTAAEIAVINR